MMNEEFDLNLEQGKAVAFDFDGVIHKYSKGWQDGSIYDEPNMEMLDLILLLQLAKIPCVIISTREPSQIKEWWNKQGFTIMAKPLFFETKFFNDCTYVGITNRKIPAQLYIDDRAYKYTGQTIKEFLIDCSKSENEDFLQEPKTDILDKIRAEIEEYKSRQLSLATGVEDLEKGKQIAIEYVLAIIDKYKTESEDKE